MKLPKILRRSLAVALALLSVWMAIPVASATAPFPLYSGTVTASGQSSAVSLKTNTMGWVTVDVTAASGTIVYDVWFECSNDEGVTFLEIPHNGALKTSGTASANTLSAAGRDIVDNKTSTTAEKFSAIYAFIPCQKIRLAWTLSGSTPSVTFTARFGGK